MKIEDLFGTDEFLAPESGSDSGEDLSAYCIRTEEVSENNNESSSDDEKIHGVCEEIMDQTEGNTVEISSGFSRTAVVFTIGLIMAGLVVLSIVTIWVKIRKNTLSYELAAQIRLMKKLSKKKALYKLEYSYLRSTDRIRENINIKNWVEVVPKNIVHVKMKNGSSVSRNKIRLSRKNNPGPP
ncbi:MAG: hypothetical protein JXR95_14260 [Deltaproteobacteria bacterium]|nr:hypothetical protein [Deltaproteobacteria bacterium]